MESLSEHLIRIVLMHVATSSRPGCSRVGQAADNPLEMSRRLISTLVCKEWRAERDAIVAAILRDTFDCDVDSLLAPCETQSVAPSPPLFAAQTLFEQPIFQPEPVVTKSGVVVFNAEDGCDFYDYFDDAYEALKVLWTLKSVADGLREMGHKETADRCTFSSLYPFIAPIDMDTTLSARKEWVQPWDEYEEGPNPLGIDPRLSPCAGGSMPRWVKSADDCPLTWLTSPVSPEDIYAQFNKLGSLLLRVEFGRDSIMQFPLFYICRASPGLWYGMYTELLLT